MPKKFISTVFLNYLIIQRMATPTKEQKMILLITQALVQLRDRATSQRQKFESFFTRCNIEYQKFTDTPTESSNEVDKQIVSNVCN